MKKILLIFSLAILSIAVKAQFNPLSIFSLIWTYDACPHNQEIWSASGYTIYQINFVKDANGYITSMQTISPPPLGTNANKYKVIGSRIGNVYSANTYEKAPTDIDYHAYSKENWYGDGTKDTAFIVQDTTAAGWVNKTRYVLYYTGSICDSSITYNWTNNSWQIIEKMTISYVSGKRYKCLNYALNLSTSTVDYNGSITYYYSTKLDSMISTKINTSSIEYINQKYFFTSDANGKSTSLTSYDWQESSQTFTQAIHITFETSIGIDEISKNKLDIFPNPASDILHINGISDNAFISIYDISGKLMTVERISQNRIDINHLSPGIYILSILDNNKLVTKKFIKQ